MVKTFGKDQLNAYNITEQFLNSEELAMVIVGYAGTGKTYLSKALLQLFSKLGKHCTLCAPTHQAKIVLEKSSGQDAFTLHKLLSLSPLLQIEELDFNNLLFSRVDKDTFPYNAIIVCDEASMVNDALFDLFLKLAEENNCKIIFIGDEAQLKPVKGLGVSKVFSLDTKAILSEIFRQREESGLTTVLPTLRESSINRFETTLGTEGSIYCYDSAKDFILKSLPDFKRSVETANIIDTKMLAYTNDRVKALNTKLRSILFDPKKEYSKGEFLLSGENFNFNGNNFWNSMNYVIAEKPIKIDLKIPYFMSVPAYKLSLYDSSDKAIYPLTIISKDFGKNGFDSLAYSLEQARLEAFGKKKKGFAAKKAIDRFFTMKDSFTTPMELIYDGRTIRKKSFDYGYCSTVHKIQGSSINNVYVDMKDINECYNSLELRQLQYVAMSRTTKDVHIYQ